MIKNWEVFALKNHDDQMRQVFQTNLIAGIDEAGRGPLAGPVVAAAVILKEKANLLLVNDSKKLSANQRLKALEEIKGNAIAIGIGIATNQEIDQINILNATKLAMQRAVNKLSVKPQLLLIDHVEIDSSIKQIAITKGDQISLSIAAASIIAKTYRDELMNEYHLQYPEYGFNKHMGYPTKHHLAMIKTYGITPIHRQTFKPIMQLL